MYEITLRGLTYCCMYKIGIKRTKKTLGGNIADDNLTLSLKFENISL